LFGVSLKNKPPLSCLLAAAGLSFFAMVAQVPAWDIAAAAQIDPDVVSPPQAAPSSAIWHAIDVASNYLEHVCGPDGKFNYKVNVNLDEKRQTYNILRHAGTVYALASLNSARADPQIVDVMARAARFLRQNYVGPGPRSDQLVVWSKPLPQKSDAELGATGLGLVALVALERAKPNSVPAEDLEAMARFIVFLQRSDGSFISKYRAETGPVGDFESLYYPGEAALGLLNLYELDHSRNWLIAAARALSYLAKSRANLADVPPDHWALIATAKLLPHYADSRSPASREELLVHAIQICHSLMKGQQKGSAADMLDGSFDPTGRTAPTATRMEGLLAALEILPPSNLGDDIKDVVDRGIDFLLQAQILDGQFTGGMPNSMLAKSSSMFSIRIDYVQHALSAWLRYQQLFSKPQ
jgi:hypothetical protein